MSLANAASFSGNDDITPVRTEIIDTPEELITPLDSTYRPARYSMEAPSRFSNALGATAGTNPIRSSSTFWSNARCLEAYSTNPNLSAIPGCVIPSFLTSRNGGRPESACTPGGNSYPQNRMAKNENRYHSRVHNPGNLDRRKQRHHCIDQLQR